MKRGVRATILIVLGIVFGKGVYSCVESSVGFCADEPASPPAELERYYLIITMQARENPAALRAFTVAARRWRAVGIAFVVLAADDPQAHLSTKTVIADINGDDCLIDDRSVGDLLGYGRYFGRGRKTAGRAIGWACLCTDALGGGYGEADWDSVAQHELGHALGLWHHFGSLMRPGGRHCSDSGFTECDMGHVYKALQIDRVTGPPPY